MSIDCLFIKQHIQTQTALILIQLAEEWLKMSHHLDTQLSFFRKTSHKLIPITQPYVEEFTLKCTGQQSGFIVKCQKTCDQNDWPSSGTLCIRSAPHSGKIRNNNNNDDENNWKTTADRRKKSLNKNLFSSIKKTQKNRSSLLWRWRGGKRRGVRRGWGERKGGNKEC